MNISKQFIAFAIIIATAFASVASNSLNNNTSSSVSASPIDSTSVIYQNWDDLANKYFKKYDDFIKTPDKKLRFAKDEYDSYKTLCKELNAAIESMENKSYYTTINFNIDKWLEASDTFKDVIKKDLDGGKDEKTWEANCKKLYDAYLKLADRFDTEKFYFAQSLINKNEELQNTINTKDAEINRLKIIEQEYTTLKNQKDEFGKNLNGAFEVCTFFPLAVKYNKTYVDLAYNGAAAMVSAKAISNDPKIINNWNKFSPLLKNYGIYNEDVIKYILDIKEMVMSKGGKIEPTDIETFKGLLDYKMPKYSKYYNNKEVSIKYLDDVLNEFFSLLEGYVSNDRGLKESIFNNFILNNLDSEYDFSKKSK